jgi:AcrR family transcriptional regulator
VSGGALTLAAAAASTAAATRPGRGNQREHILDTALELMSEHGADATSMRRLASACDLNVAAIYHSFPSTADLLRAVIAERQYAALLATPPIPDLGLPPRERLVALIVAMWEGSVEEESVWRLLLAESFRANPDALGVGAELIATVEGAFHAWLGELFPELTTEVGATSQVLLGQLFALLVENLFQPEAERADHARRRAEAVALVVFPDA